MEKVSQWIKKHAQRISVHVFVSYLEVQELVAQELGDGRSSRSCPSICPTGAFVGVAAWDSARECLQWRAPRRAGVDFATMSAVCCNVTDRRCTLVS